MIGYSPEKMYEDCISMLVEQLDIKDENLKTIILYLLIDWFYLSAVQFASGSDGP